MSAHIETAPGWEHLRFEGLWGAEGEPVKVRPGRRVDRVLLDDERCYLKRWEPARVQDRIVDRVKGASPLTPGMREWRNLGAMRELGIATAEGVAAGEAPDGRSLVVTREVEGAVRIDDQLTRLAPSGRRALVQKAAELVRSLHGAGWIHRDLYATHFLIAPDGRIVLLDLARMDRLEGDRWIVKDLASLYRSSGAAAAEKLRFFLAYLGRDRLAPESKGLATRVLGRARRGR